VQENVTITQAESLSIKSAHLFGRLFFMPTALCLLIVCAAVHLCMPSDDLSMIILASIFLIGNIVLIALASADNGFVACVMIVSLVLKIVLAYYQACTARWGESDQLMYFAEGSQLSNAITDLGGRINIGQIWGTELIVSISAIMFRIVGSSFVLGMMIFATISLWGQYLYYRAFVGEFPLANSRIGALGLFLWPSILFWTSELGKDSLMLTCLGACTLCISKLARKHTWAVSCCLVIATAGCFLIRPHIGSLLLLSFIIASRSWQRRSNKSTIRKALRFAIATFICVVVVYLCAKFLELSNFIEASTRIETAVSSNMESASGFDPGNNWLIRIISAPLLLIRPFPWELNGSLAAIASLEGILFLTLLIWRSRWLLALASSARKEPFVLFVSAFVSLNVFLLGMSSSNFGLLARQRVMILPMMMICILACPVAAQNSCTVTTVHDRNEAAVAANHS
jgi:hypothetical protein